MGKEEKIYVAGHRGLVGSALLRALDRQGFRRLLTRTRAELDLLDQRAVRDFFETERPDQVYLAAAKVGGIHANSTYPAEFIYENLMVEANVIHEAWRAGVKRLLFLGSSCIYPRDCPQPIKEEYLLTGPLEATNEPYAVAKIAGIKLCESYNRQYGTDFRSVMPTNLYGPNDNFHPKNSHVIPALLRRFHEAKVHNAAEVVIWGSGSPKREFLHVNDMAQACLHIMAMDEAAYRAHTAPNRSHINVGSGRDCSIRELAELIARVTDFSGKVVFDPSKSDGTPRKLLDVSRLHALGWRDEVGLEDGLLETYGWFLSSQSDYRRGHEG